MIDKIIMYLENYIEKLKADGLLEKKYNDAKEIADKNKKVDEQIKDVISKSPFNEDEKNTLIFIFDVLYEINCELDDKQKHLLGLFKNYLDEQIKKSKNEESIKRIEDLCVSIKSSETFSEFSYLNEILSNINVSKIDRFNIIKELISRNYTVSLKDDYSDDEEVDFDYNNDENEIIEIFKKYNLDYFLLSNDLRKLLINKVEISKMENILNLLFNLDNNILNNFFSKSQRIFTKILICSDVSIINNVIKILKENNIDAIKFINLHPNVLIPSKGIHLKIFQKSSGDSDDVVGEYNNFVNNVEFFKSKGYNIAAIEDRCVTALLAPSHVIKNSYNIITNIYKFNISEETMIFLKDKKASLNLDRFIEIPEYGFKYINDNRSKMYFMKEEFFYLAKIRYLYNKHDEFKKRVDSSFNFNYMDEPMFYTRGKKLVIHQNKTYSDVNNVSIEKARELLGSSTIEENTYSRITDRFLGTVEHINTNIFDSNIYYQALENDFKVDEYRYQIGDTIISRFKFLRICTLFKEKNIILNSNAIKFALEYNSIISSYDIDNINSFLHSISLKKERGNNI